MALQPKSQHGAAGRSRVEHQNKCRCSKLEVGDAKSAELADLKEDSTGALKLSRGQIRLGTGPKQIITPKLRIR